MKSKYLSRKFWVSIVGLAVSIVATFNDNTLVALGGLALAACFVIGESIVDANSCVKQSKKVDVTDYHCTEHEVKDNGKAET